VTDPPKGGRCELDGSEQRLSGTANEKTVDLKLEVVVIPVSDVNRVKEFYGILGWRLDANPFDNGLRVVRFTPPGSGSSVQFDSKITSAAPGSAEGQMAGVRPGGLGAR
jgi:hypothetical protein